MMYVRPAEPCDLIRIAEIEVFNYRLNFYPIFRSDAFYFGELRTDFLAAAFRKELSQLWVYDDGVVKGFCMIDGTYLRRLFVEPVLQGQGIGDKLLRFAVEEMGVTHLWALEKNVRAIAFYQRHGFRLTQERKLEAGTEEYLVRMER